MSAKKTYAGGCHCGAVRFETELELGEVFACNCSICSKMGWRLAMAKEGAFRLLSGSDSLTDYQFGKKHIHHPFCRVCGVRSFGHGKDASGMQTYSINVRCLDEVGERADELPVRHFDGKSL